MPDIPELTDWHHAIELAPVGVFRTTPSGRFVFANQKLADIFGYASPAELLGISDIGKDLLVQPKQRAEAKLLLEQHGHCNNFLYEARSKDGRILFLSFSARLVKTESDTYYEGFVVDVTDQKLAELRLKNILVELQAMTYQCEPDHPWKMKWVSDGCRELTGYYKKAFLEDEVKYGDLIYEDHQKYVSRAIQEAKKTNTTFTLVYPIRTSNNEKKWVFERGRLLRDHQGQIIGLEGVVQNYNQYLDRYQHEQQDIANANERQNQMLRRAMWLAMVVPFLALNTAVVSIAAALICTGNISDSTLAYCLGATIAQVAGIVLVIARYLFPTASTPMAAPSTDAPGIFPSIQPSRDGSFPDSEHKELMADALPKK